MNDPAQPSRWRAAIAALLGLDLSSAAKSGIFGEEFRTFMGISSGDGVTEIADTPGDYARARTAESYVYRCVDLRGRAFAQVPLRVWEKDKQGKRSSIEHPALGIIEATNPLSWVAGRGRLMRYTEGAMDLHGRSCWRLATSNRGVPTEIYWTPPLSFKPLHGYDKGDSSTPFWGIKYTYKGGTEDLPAEKLVYFTTDNFEDPVLGTSKIQVLKDAVNLRRRSVDANLKFFANSMVPPWVMTTEKNMSDETHDRLMRHIRRWLSGANNQTPLIAGGGTDVKILGMSHEDAKWIEQQRLSQEEIYSVFGVPVVLDSSDARNTYDNVRQGKLLFWHDTAIPDLDQLAEDLTRSYLWRFWSDAQGRGYEFGFDYSAIEGLGEDIALVWERFKGFMEELDKQVQHGVLVPAQARQLLEQLCSDLGIDGTPYQGDVPQGNERLVPYQLIPSADASVQTLIDIMAARGANPQLVEDVPGAPHAGEDALRPNPNKQPPPATEPPAQEPPAADDQAKQAELLQSAIEKAIEPILDELRAAAPKAPALQVVRKAPHPGPIRDNRLGPAQKKLTSGLKKLFQDQQTEVLRNLRGDKGHLANVGRKASTPDVSNLYDAAATAAAIEELVRTGVITAAQAAYLASAEDYGLDVSWSDDSTFVDDFLGSRSALIKGIDLTTQQQLLAALDAGITEGESMTDLANRVTDVFRFAIDSRSEMIARTETIQAYGFASIQSYRDAGVEKAQMYDGDNDDQDEDGNACADVNGRIVSLDEAEELMAAEHPNGTRAVAPYMDDSSDTEDDQALDLAA